MTGGHNTKIEDEIFETSISSPSDNIDKVDEALRVMTKENKVSLLVEFSTPTVRHGKVKELKRIEKSIKPVYDENSFHNLLGRSFDYDFKDNAANIQGGEPLDFIIEIVKDDRNVKQPVFGEGVGVNVVDIEKVGVDVVEVEKVRGDDVGVEMVGVDVKKDGGDDVGVKKVQVDVEKPDQVEELCLRKTRVYNRRPLTVFESMLGSEVRVGSEGLKAPEIIPNVKDINTLQNTDGSVKTRGIAQNDGTLKPSEAIPSTGAAGLAGAAVRIETLPSRGGMSILSVPIGSHRPIS
ncbi:hypothetical protein F0562_006422 [Nyssa sinensis]|uniref:Uncharacterized protein n=1 Tax=Nyssa sinensis TaxID=561372 RepID=A0A5J5AS42_9ASTE|nr:hypothetical protein F0562_006422 [Nyssa sinensis]